MYKVVVNVSGKRARIVPDSHRLLTAERDFGDITQMDALANRDSLTEAVRGLLADKGILDGDLYTIELPDALTPQNVNEQEVREKEVEEGDGKGEVTKRRTRSPKSEVVTPAEKPLQAPTAEEAEAEAKKQEAEAAAAEPEKNETENKTETKED